MKIKSFRLLMVRMVLLLALLGIGSAGCSSAPKKVKIAMFTPSGLPTYQAAYQAAAKFALAEAGGKAGNVDVELVMFDESDKDKNEPFSSDVVQKELEEILKDPDIVAVIGPSTSSSSKLAIPVLNRAAMTEITATATWPGLTKAGYGPGEPGMYYPTGRQNFFRVTGADDAQGVAGARWAKQLGHQRVFVAYNDSIYGVGVAGVFDVTATDLGLEILGKVSFPEGQSPSDADAMAASILKDKPDVVYLVATGTNVPLLSALHRADPQVLIMVPDGLVHQEAIDQLGADSDINMLGTMPILPPDKLGTPAAEKFIQDYRKFYGEDPDHLATLMYEGTRALLYAIGRAKEPTREGVLASMQNMGDFDGLIGTWHFDAHGDISLVVMGGYQVKDGKWEFVETLR